MSKFNGDCLILSVELLSVKVVERGVEVADVADVDHIAAKQSHRDTCAISECRFCAAEHQLLVIGVGVETVVHHRKDRACIYAKYVREAQRQQQRNIYRVGDNAWIFENFRSRNVESHLGVLIVDLGL